MLVFQFSRLVFFTPGFQGKGFTQVWGSSDITLYFFFGIAWNLFSFGINILSWNGKFPVNCFFFFFNTGCSIKIKMSSWQLTYWIDLKIINMIFILAVNFIIVTKKLQILKLLKFEYFSLFLNCYKYINFFSRKLEYNFKS